MGAPHSPRAEVKSSKCVRARVSVCMRSSPRCNHFLFRAWHWFRFHKSKSSSFIVSHSHSEDFKRNDVMEHCNWLTYMLAYDIRRMLYGYVCEYIIWCHLYDRRQYPYDYEPYHLHLRIYSTHTHSTAARARNGYNIKIAGSIDQRIIEETGRQQHVEWNGDDDRQWGGLTENYMMICVLRVPALSEHVSFSVTTPCVCVCVCAPLWKLLSLEIDIG